MVMRLINKFGVGGLPAQVAVLAESDKAALRDYYLRGGPAPDVIEQAHLRGLWISCDCVSNTDSNPPFVIPVQRASRNSRSFFLRRSGDTRAEHAANCPFMQKQIFSSEEVVTLRPRAVAKPLAPEDWVISDFGQGGTASGAADGSHASSAGRGKLERLFLALVEQIQKRHPLIEGDISMKSVYGVIAAYGDTVTLCAAKGELSAIKLKDVLFTSWSGMAKARESLKSLYYRSLKHPRIPGYGILLTVADQAEAGELVLSDGTQIKTGIVGMNFQTPHLLMLCVKATNPRWFSFGGWHAEALPIAGRCEGPSG